jgi:hypothetical protein
MVGISKLWSQFFKQGNSQLRASLLTLFLYVAAGEEVGDVQPFIAEGKLV